MKVKPTKPYFRKKGYYADGRERVIVEWRDEYRGIHSIALPKPEKLIEIIGHIKNSKKSNTAKG